MDAARPNGKNGFNGKSHLNGPGFREIMAFARGFLKAPMAVGSLVPSSPFLVEQVLRPINWERARVIVEYGPGTGSFTRAILGRMLPEARLVALEINPLFHDYLGRTLADSRLHLRLASATEVKRVLRELDCGRADYIISGIPFRTLPERLRDPIVRNARSVLAPNGRFLVYQFSGAVRPYLERVFSDVARGRELLNILPARLYYCAP